MYWFRQHVLFCYNVHMVDIWCNDNRYDQTFKLASTNQSRVSVVGTRYVVEHFRRSTILTYNAISKHKENMRHFIWFEWVYKHVHLTYAEWLSDSSGWQCTHVKPLSHVATFPLRLHGVIKNPWAQWFRKENWPWRFYRALCGSYGVLVGDWLCFHCALTTLPLRASSCRGVRTACTLGVHGAPLHWRSFVCIPCSNPKVTTHRGSSVFVCKTCV